LLPPPERIDTLASFARLASACRPHVSGEGQTSYSIVPDAQLTIASFSVFGRIDGPDGLLLPLRRRPERHFPLASPALTR
jgi:hypothetical protein